jgi:hypothetical protein
VLPGFLPEKSAFRDAHNKGKAANEAVGQTINAHVDPMMIDLLGSVAATIKGEEKGIRRKPPSRGAA